MTEGKGRTLKELRLQNNPFDDKLGKVPPQAVDLEEAVLGACMVEKSAFNKVKDLLVADDFYKDSHTLIFQAIIDLWQIDTKIDILLVTNKLREKGQLEMAGGPYYMTELTSKVNSAEHIESHALIIKEKSIKRQLISFGAKVQMKSYEDAVDAFELIDDTQKNFNSISKFSSTSTQPILSDMVMATIKDIEAVMGGKQSAVGLHTGFPCIDKIVVAWVSGELIIIAARPGMGKSALALRLCMKQAGMFKVPSAFFSLEMSNQSLVDRMISMESELMTKNIRFRKLDDWQYKQMINKVERSGLIDFPLYLVDDCFTIQQIRNRAIKLVDEFGVKFIVVDYLQLASVSDSNKSSTRENEVSAISRALKMLSKELNVPIIALSQLSRAVEIRGGDKRPKLSDLRESGSLEQDADIVAFIYRPEYYGIDKDEGGFPLTVGYTEFIVAKNRNGAIEKADLKFIGSRTDFVEFENETIPIHSEPNF
jgi:replicative DNA helicase